MATAATAPMFVPASVLGRGGAKAPSERIAMGFIGLGGQGSGHLMGGAWTYVPGGYVARTDVQVLEKLADGAKGARLTKEAKASLERLNKRAAAAR